MIMRINYKKIFRTKKIRYKILQFFEFVPDKVMLYVQYYIKMGEWLNLNKPRTFQEKIQWIKLYYRNPLMQICADKYKVREYVSMKGLSYILNPLYQHVQDANEIVFSSLPNDFVAKVSNGSGTNIIVRNKDGLDKDAFINRLNSWRDSCRNKSVSREWAYDSKNPSIVIEKLLCNDKEDLYDYKFLTYHGKVKYIVFDIGRFKKHKRNIYDREWNILDVKSEYDNTETYIERPENLDEMINVAEKLGEDFLFVRVDLYNVGKKIVFGEMTFYPWSGYESFLPTKYNDIIGADILIEKCLPIK